MEDAFAQEIERTAFSDADRKKASDLLRHLHHDYLVLGNDPDQREGRFSAELELLFHQMTERDIEKNRRPSIAMMSDGELNLLTVDVLPESHIPILGRLICIVKRLSRKMLFWYLQPVFLKQSRLNQSLNNAIIEQARLIREIQQDLPQRCIMDLGEVDADDREDLP